MRFAAACALMFGILIITTPGVDAQAAHPGGCITYGYSHDGFNHYSLIMNGSAIIGTTILIQTNCAGHALLYVDGSPVSMGNGSVAGTVSPGMRNISVQFDGHNVTWENVTVYPAISLTAVFTDSVIEPRGEFVTEDDMSSREIMVSITSIGLALVGSVFVVDRIAKERADRAPLREEGSE